MNTELLNTCELFIQNREVLRSTFRWEGEEMLLLGSALLTSGGREADADLMRRCERMLKERTGRFSALRGDLKMTMVCRMACSDDPGELLANTERAYNLIRISRGRRSEIYYLAAIFMACAATDKEQLLGMTDKADALFKGSAEASASRHSGLMSGDHGYAVAAAVASSSEEDTDVLLQRTSEYAEHLSAAGADACDAWMTPLLAAAGSPEVDGYSSKIEDISRELSARGMKITGTDAEPLIASAAGIDMDAAQIAVLAADADNYLSAQKGFGIIGTGAGRRNMYALALAIDACEGSETADAVIASAVLEGALEAQFAAFR